jgi:integrase
MVRARRGHGRRSARDWGKIRKLPSGRYQASHLDAAGGRQLAPVTFRTREAAASWLAVQRAAADAGRLRTPTTLTLAGYAAGWLARRKLADRSRYEYSAILNARILPELGHVRLDLITPAMVREWHDSMGDAAPASTAAAYGLLHAILATAAADDLTPANPARLRGAGASSVKRKTTTRPATVEQVETIASRMPPRLALLVNLAAYCGLRFGELAELRRADVEADGSVIRVRRAVARIPGNPGGPAVVKDPKSSAGVRDVAVPPHLHPAVRGHLGDHTGPEPGALLFPGYRGNHLAPSALYASYYPARAAAGRSDLRFHDLRHTAATLAVQAGASLPEVMRRLGHSTPGTALRYLHATDERDAEVAAGLSGLAQVIELRPRRNAK